MVKYFCSFGSSGEKADCRVWTGKTQSEPGTFLKNSLFGNNFELTKSCKNENSARNTCILHPDSQLLTFYPLFSHIWALPLSLIFFLKHFRCSYIMALTSKYFCVYFLKIVTLSHQSPVINFVHLYLYNTFL